MPIEPREMEKLTGGVLSCFLSILPVSSKKIMAVIP